MVGGGREHSISVHVTFNFISGTTEKASYHLGVMSIVNADSYTLAV